MPRSSAVHGRPFCLTLLFLLINSSHPSPTREIFNNRAIVYYNVAEDYFTAYETCRSKDMQLLTIHDDLETTLMFTKMKESKLNSTWIGATDFGHSREWRWSFSGKKLTYISWAPKQPNGVDQNCLALLADFGHGWYDYWCSEKLNYFCEDMSHFH